VTVASRPSSARYAARVVGPIRSALGGLGAFVSLGIVTVACGAVTGHEPDASSCAWVTSFDAATCSVGLALAECHSPSVSSWCITNDLADASCIDYPPQGPCMNACNAGEYAAACGFMTTPIDPPSSACRSVGIAPSGTGYFCCPCGM
jgi:hypothetical protein